MVNPEELNREELRQRFPRLLRRMQWTAILSNGEVEGALSGYLLNRKHGRIISRGSEAVDHFGGCEQVVSRAIITRRFAPEGARVRYQGFYNDLIDEGCTVLRCDCCNARNLDGCNCDVGFSEYFD
jgi:hypothetical protein